LGKSRDGCTIGRQQRRNSDDTTAALTLSSTSTVSLAFSCIPLLKVGEDVPTMDYIVPSPPPPQQLSHDETSAILTYLSLPSATDLSTPPLPFLATHLDLLPTPLLLPFSRITTPRQRTSIPGIKSRRLLYANRDPKPRELRADSGRLRWPLLWERLGGNRLPPPSGDVEEEEDWVRESFLPGKEDAQHVKKLGGFLRGLAEEREMEGVARARREERRLDDVGEEFDEESDEEEDVEAGEEAQERQREQQRESEEPIPNDSGLGALEAEDDQDEVKRVFERRLLELFLDGMDVSTPHALLSHTPCCSFVDSSGPRHVLIA
jgi:hypothetical protein